MNKRDLIYKFFDNDESRIRSEIIVWNRSYSFTSSPNSFDVTKNNQYQHKFGNDYPSNISGSTVSSAYLMSTSINSFSGYYYHSLMMLFKLGAIPTFENIFTITGNISSNVASFGAGFNYGLHDIQRPYEQYTLTTYTANRLFVYTTNKMQFGDNIKIGGFSAYVTGAVFAVDNGGSSRLYQQLDIVHPSYTGSGILGWILRDFGKAIFFAPNDTLSSALTAIDRFDYDNEVNIHNITIHITLDNTEFNYSENPSFYQKFYNSGKLQNTFITTIGLYNDSDDLLAVVKLATPVKKYFKLPVTFKIVMDQY